MRFRLAHGVDAANGRRGSAWLPQFQEALPGQLPPTMAVTIGNERRQVVSALVRLAEVFTRNAEDCRRLGQDCIAFAYAWESGRDVRGVRFFRAGGIRVRPRQLRASTVGDRQPPEVPPGGILFTSAGRPADPDFLENQPHYLVRATCDDAEPLYMAKLGVSGPVVLTSLAQSRAFYAVRGMAVASDFRQVEG